MQEVFEGSAMRNMLNNAVFGWVVVVYLLLLQTGDVKAQVSPALAQNSTDTTKQKRVGELTGQIIDGVHALGDGFVVNGGAKVYLHKKI